jgi:hypothetical protein
MRAYQVQQLYANLSNAEWQSTYAFRQQYADTKQERLEYLNWQGLNRKMGFQKVGLYKEYVISTQAILNYRDSS